MKEELIAKMAGDMQIYPYSTETYNEYHARLLYCALVEWLKTCILDKTNSEYDGERKSKHYLRHRGEIILDSFLKLFPECYSYFYLDNKGKSEDNPVTNLREKMINSGELIYKNDGIGLPSGKIASISSQYSRILGISNNSKNVGITKIKKSENDAYEFQLINSNYFDKYLKSICWSECNDVTEMEYYNPNIPKVTYKCWESLEKISENEIFLSRLKVNDYLHDFYWLKKIDNYYFVSKVNDSLVEYEEIRRFILWQRSNHGNAINAKWINKDTYSILKLYSKIPFVEQNIIDTYCWPRDNIYNQYEYVVPTEMGNEIMKILLNLRIQIMED